MASRYYSVFVGHLEPDTSKHELREVFNKCGEVVDIFICQNDRPGGFSYGFVRYMDLASAERAIRELNRWEVRGSRMIVQLAKDTLEKVKSEKKLAEKNEDRKANIQRKHRTTSNVIEDTMYLARLKENCTMLRVNHSDGDESIRHLMDDIQKCDTRKNVTQWGPLSDPVTDFDYVNEKLVSRSLEAGMTGSLIGTKKSQEFISSLKTIMQEIEDFLSRSAKSASDYPTSLSEHNELKTLQGLDRDRENLMMRQDERPLMVEKVQTLSIDPNEDEKPLRSLGDHDSIEYVRGRKESEDSDLCKDLSLDETVIIDNTGSFVSDLEMLEIKRDIKSPEWRGESLELENDSVIESGSVRKKVNPVNRQLKSHSSAFFTFSPIVHVDSVETGNKHVTEISAANDEFMQSPSTRFYLDESTKVGNSKTVGKVPENEQSFEEETRYNLAKTRVKADIPLENKQDLLTVKSTVNSAFQKRKCRSAEHDLFELNSLDSDSGRAPGEINCNTNQKNKEGQFVEGSKSKLQTRVDVQTNRRDSSVTDEKEDSSALEALFAKLPPLSSFRRSDSRDSSLSEDSVDGVDDSGVESDFVLRSDSNSAYPQSLQDHSQQLKSILGIGASIKSDSFQSEKGPNKSKEHFSNGVRKPDSSVRYTGRGVNLFHLRGNDCGTGRGHGFHVKRMK